MARVYGKKYSSTVFSGYTSQAAVEQHVATNYPLPAAEVEQQGSDYVVYFEDDVNGELYLGMLDVSAGIR